MLSSDVSITAESTDLTDRVGEKFIAVCSVDRTLDLRDENYTRYTYSLNIKGLPDCLKAEGDTLSNDIVRETHHHEITLQTGN
jgi:hypothetical protein